MNQKNKNVAKLADGSACDETSDCINSNCIPGYCGGPLLPYCNGTIDEVKIWNRALSEQEINASYNNKLYKLEREFTQLNPGIYNFTAYVVDQAGQLNTTEKRTVEIHIANEIEGDQAIETAINSSTPQATKYKTQKVYIVNTSNSQWQGTADYLVIQNNPQKRWILNYITSGETHLNARNLSNVYVLETTNKTRNQIINEVSTLINSTKT